MDNIIIWTELSIRKIILTIIVGFVLYVLYKFFIQPYRILKVYTRIPGSIVTYISGKKVLKVIKNVKEVTPEIGENHPYLSSEYYSEFIKYPDLRFTIDNRYGVVMYLCLTDHELIAEYHKNPKNYYKYQPKCPLKDYFRYGLGGTQGENWKFQRKVISEAFHFENLKKVIPIVEDAVKDIFGKYNSIEPEYSALEEFQKITGEVIGRAFFGENLNEYQINGRVLTLELADLLIENSKLFYVPLYQIFGDLALFWSSEFRKCKRDSAAFAKFCLNILRNMTKKIKSGKIDNQDGRKGLLQILIERDQSQGVFSEKELLGNFINFFFAGMDSSGHLLAMIVYFLSQNPQVKEKLLACIDFEWDGKSPLTFDKIQSMDYLQAVIDEAFRMATPIPTTWPRRATVDHYIKDVPVKKGTVIIPYFLKSNYNSQFYKDVGIFKPERWIRGDKAYERPNDPFAFTPFSAGQRNCIGQHFAQSEMKIILCYFLKTFDFELKTPPHFEMIQRFLVEPKNPMKFSLRKK